MKTIQKVKGRKDVQTHILRGENYSIVENNKRSQHNEKIKDLKSPHWGPVYMVTKTKSDNNYHISLDFTLVRPACG